MSATQAIDCTAVFDAMERWIKQRPGLEKGNYYNPADYQMGRKSEYWSGVRAYQSEMRSITKDGTRAKAALKEARQLNPARPEVLESAFSAFSGRLQWKEGRLDYCTGQYWPTEYRKAAAAVLESYIAGWRRAEALANPKTFTFSTMADVMEANKASGYHWFEKDTMRFFKCRIVSRLVAGKRFVTSERGPSDTRARFTVREVKPDGGIDTIGKFQEYSTKRAAMRDILREA